MDDTDPFTIDKNIDNIIVFITYAYHVAIDSSIWQEIVVELNRAVFKIKFGFTEIGESVIYVLFAMRPQLNTTESSIV